MMTTTPPSLHRRTGLLLLALFMPLLPLRGADEPNPSSAREILRDALYAEEVTRDPAKAAEAYGKVLELYEAQQPFAATALFRLAEVRRKQGNKEEAAKLYQRLLREFPAAEVEGKLARENLAAIGANPGDAAAVAADDEETKELRRLQELSRTSPDLAREPVLLQRAAEKGQLRVLAYLVESGMQPRQAGVLDDAVRSGNLKAVEFLIAKGCNPAESPNDGALSVAVQKKFLSIAELLLKSGANANYHKPIRDRQTQLESWLSPLHMAAGRLDERMCQLLLQHGADPNALPENCFNSLNMSSEQEEGPIGAPLHQALCSDWNNASSVPAILLKGGAKPGMAVPQTGMTPLHFAASNKNLHVLRALLEAGATPNVRTAPDAKISPGGSGSFRPGMTPLDFALWEGPLDAARLLLDKGADPNLADVDGNNALHYALVHGNPGAVPLLLEHGAKADKPGLLHSALKHGRETVKRLLDAGADPNAVVGSATVLQAALDLDQSAGGSEDSTLEVVQLLLDRGAKADAASLVKSMRNAGPEVQRLLSERYILPELLSRPAVTLIYPDQPGQSSILAKREGETAPGQLEALLLANPSVVPQFLLRGTNRKVIAELVTIQRREPGGAIKRISGRLDGMAAMPKLEWGDVVELARDPALSSSPSVSGNDSNTLSPECIWNLGRFIAVPVTVKQAGESHAITLRGDCLSWEPGAPVVPLLRAGALAQLLWSWVTPDALVIHRSGWPEIRIDAGSAEWNSFDFQAGDEITPVYLEDLAKQRDKVRQDSVTLTVPGTNFAKRWDASLAKTVPTLVEVLADLYAFWSPVELGTLPEDGTARWGTLAAREQGLWARVSTDSLPVPVIPAHPDFSKIRILRSDGTTLEVDLTQAIASTTAETTPGQARGHDVKLHAGDLIELPLLKREGAAAWRGFSAAEARFFGKVLEGVFQYVNPSGELRRRAVVWQPVRWVDSPGGPLPLPPEPGVASTKARFQEVLSRDSQPTLARGESEEELRPPSDFFLRDGDKVRLSGIMVPRPNVGPAPAQPRGNVPVPTPPRPRR